MTRSSRRAKARANGTRSTLPHVDADKLVAAARARLTEPAAKAFFDRLEPGYTSWSRPELELLVRASEVNARIEAVRAVIKRDGLLVTGQKNTRVRHPALMIERAALAELRALLKQLKLEDAAE